MNRTPRLGIAIGWLFSATFAVVCAGGCSSQAPKENNTTSDADERIDALLEDLRELESANANRPTEQVAEADEEQTPEDADETAMRRPADSVSFAATDQVGEGVVTTTAKAYMAAKRNVVFEIQIPQAMQYFRAEHGRVPNSHDEFMEKIIKDNLIKLPELPANHEYVYDPQAGELMVEFPQSATSSP